MLWVKALHIVFITSWFAGLFYLPRIFVNLAQETPGPTTEPRVGDQRPPGRKGASRGRS